MMYPDFYASARRGNDPDVDPYMLKRATNVAKSLVMNHGFPLDEFDDLRQELIVDVIHRTPWFNPRRCSWEGFVSVVARNRATELIKDDRERKRRMVFDPDLRDSAFEKCSECDKRSQIHLELDTEKLLSRVPKKLRKIGVQLCDYSASEVAESNGKSRARIYQMAAQLKQQFERNGYSHPRRLKRAS